MLSKIERERKEAWQKYGYHIRTIELLAGAIQDASRRMEENPKLLILMLAAPMGTLNEAFDKLLKEAADGKQD